MLLPQPCPHRPRRVRRPQPFLPHPLLPAHTACVSPRRPVTRTARREVSTAHRTARRQHTPQRRQPQDKSGVGGAEERGCGGGACVGGECRGTGGGRGPGPRGRGGERACRRRGPTRGSCPRRPHSPPRHTLTHSTEREREERGEADLPKREWVWEGAVCLAAAAREEAE
eukprot:2472250-Rhodomonas_salina.1